VKEGNTSDLGKRNLGAGVEKGLLLEGIVSMHTEPATVALPSDLLAAVDKVVQEGRARSRDELVESALRRQLAELRRSALDAEFRHMADDVDYQRDVHQILGEFAQADWETLQEEPGQGANDRRS
jgi:Arc/MetJ-type ribon-helix-helix transcriptional regulator